MTKRRNRLAFEKSPYLLQHAENPVDWYPWGDEAFRKARSEDKPIFLSIGYSTCHWCHVMAHESFEDDMVARMMNDAFVCIKVDREERPDIDQTYMAVAQALTGSGGWPLNVIMTPEKKPFFAATYIPKEGRFGRIGMLDLVPKIKTMWKCQKGEILNSADQITSALKDAPSSAQTFRLDESLLKGAYQQLLARFDPVHGGFGGAPKFPSPHTYLSLLRYWKRSQDEGALQMVEITLKAMRRGGIYDQVGFGFHRYSTDAEWRLPHFEKMLYDQAMNALAYLETFQATQKDEYAAVAKEIFAYVLRDMTSKDGGFFSAEDADSEGIEGKIYLWTEDEIKELLDPKEADLVLKVFDVSKAGNFAQEATGTRSGNNVLHMARPFSDVALDMGLDEFDLSNRLDEACKRLFEARERRVHPHKDDKILADWNGLMIAAFARGAQVLEDPLYEEAARKAADFILSKMRDKEGRLLHRYRDGEAAIKSCLDDYAFFIWGLIELYEASFNTAYLKAALDLNCQLIEHFWSDEGGFYFTPDDGEELILRKKEAHDSAIPSGNAIALLNILKLANMSVANMSANVELEELASKTMEFFSAQVKGLPAAHLSFMMALDFALGPSSEVVISGSPMSKDTRKMLKALRSRFLPNNVVLLRPKDSSEITKIAPFTKDLQMLEGKATAYVCSGQVCQRPVTDAKEMMERLG